MKTDDLIARLAKDATAAPVMSPMRIFGGPLLIGAALTLALVVLWLGVQPLATAMQSGAWWFKALYAATLGFAGFGLAGRYVRPVVHGQTGWLLLALGAVAILVGFGVAQLAQAPADARRAIWLGRSASLCAPLILAVSTPIYVCVILAMRRGAPTQPTLAGAAAGLLAGGMGAALYALHCPELAPGFVATWYTLGVGLCTALGALFGARLLRW